VSGLAALDLDALWDETLSQVTKAIRSPAQRRWLTATRPVGFSEDTVVLAAPHAFAREWLENRCSRELEEVLSDTAGRDLSVVITVQPTPAPVDEGHSSTTDEEDPPTMTVPDEGESARAHEHDSEEPSDRRDDGPRPHDSTSVRPLEAPGRPPGPTVTLRPEESEDTSRLNPKYVFDNFVTGPSNRFAHAAASAVAEAPARAYNPLFIYGGAGLGKTHLLHAIGHYVRSLYPRLRVRYVTTEQFTNEFIGAIRESRNAGFQRTYRQADILLMDDIQFLERAERTQEEFFHTFNALHNAEKQIVISSDRQPRQIAHLEDRLRSRFEWGLITDVQPPDLETRIAILNKKATYESINVPPDVLEVIASRVQSNIRELEGALIRVTAFASLQGVQVDRDLAEVVLKDLLPDESRRDISVQLIQDEVSTYFGLTVEDLCSPSRTKQLVIARQIAMYLIRELTDLSLPRIGKAFGGRDHTTVMHAERKIAGLMQERRTIYDQVQELTSRIRSQARSA
jgi:chromosomal replication initiator protein